MSPHSDTDRQTEDIAARDAARKGLVVPEPELEPDQGSSGDSIQPVPPIVGMEDFNPEDRDPSPLHRPPLRRVLLLLAILGGLAALLFVPPLVSMNRYRRQIASSISASLGRPVRIDSVTLNLLPMPGFTLQNFIVGEDLGFGSEPIIRANSVTVMLRVSSLWGRRVEFSRILLDSPSVNLVRLPDGRWNLESILLQASHVKSAPTAQRSAGDAPRFPYIEATGGRLNIKSGLEKMPISLTDANFALWLPQPNQWQLRIEAHPTRTDTAATDTGTLRVEGSLGRALRLEDVPVNLTASWTGAPLGAASWILLGRDAGVRGDMALQSSVIGTAGENTVSGELHLNSLRRADFVPDHPLTVDLRCGAHTIALFHQLQQVHCEWPVADGGSGLVVSGNIPDVTHLTSTDAHAIFRGVPAEVLLDAVKVVSPRVERDLHAGGVVYGDLRYNQRPPSPVQTPSSAARHGRASGRKPELLTEPHPAGTDQSWPPLSGTVGVTHASLALGDGAPLMNAEVTGMVSGEEMTILPFALQLGGQTTALLSAHLDRNGYNLHLMGPVLRSRLAQLSRSLPQFGDGLPESLVSQNDSLSAKTPESVLLVDLNSTRSWRGGQTWTAAVAAKPAKHGRQRWNSAGGRTQAVRASHP